MFVLKDKVYDWIIIFFKNLLCLFLRIIYGIGLLSFRFSNFMFVLREILIRVSQFSFKNDLIHGLNNR